MKITILGSGTSQGIPVIGCSCPVCRSTDPRDQRLRVSVHLAHEEGYNVVIDAGPDFRQQMLRAQVIDLDAILLTHEHNDHIIGLDDVRPFNFKRGGAMPIFCSARVAGELQQRFPYAFAANPYPGAPSFDLQTVTPQTTFTCGPFTVQPVAYLHGDLPVLGYRIGGFAYLTDIKTIGAAEIEKVKGVDILVISALHHELHHSHANLAEALALIEIIQPTQAYLTHLSHRMGCHAAVEALLPVGVKVAYDGLVCRV
ncbi:MAG: MBL fold metallo-hydrolase [Bacteroidetes bacterium]|nr:MAG: MBL fold metallo-hydrolase [Bacteroidota bacterium]PTM14809.1 MAG: MBL fold metallo-hydrolase [Bacteroidota bacterium]